MTVATHLFAQDLALVLIATAVILLLLWSVRVNRDLRTLRNDRARWAHLERLERLPLIAGALEAERAKILTDYASLGAGRPQSRITGVTS